jgi:hypothetical protein
MSTALLICATLAVCVVLSVSALGREHRSASVGHEFQLTHPCPSTGLTSGRCPGYVKVKVPEPERGEVVAFTTGLESEIVEA